MRNRKASGQSGCCHLAAFGVAYGQQGPRSKSSYMEVEINEPFSETFARLSLRWLNSEEPTLSGR